MFCFPPQTGHASTDLSWRLDHTGNSMDESCMVMPDMPSSQLEFPDSYWDEGLNTWKFAISRPGTSSSMPLPQPAPAVNETHRPTAVKYLFTPMCGPSSKTPPEEQKKRRKWVMNRYIDANNGDTRNKRRRVGSTASDEHGKSSGSSDKSRSPPSTKSASATPSPLPRKASMAITSHPSTTTEAVPSELSLSTADQAVVLHGASQAVYRPLIATPAQTLYRATSAFPRSRGVGSTVNPFDSWPPFALPNVAVERLKWSCKSIFDWIWDCADTHVR